MTPNLLFMLRRRWPLLVVVPILAVAAVVIVTPRAPETPVEYTGGAYVAGDSRQSDVVTLRQAAIDIKEEEVARRAAEILGVDDEVDDYKAFARPLRVRVLTDSLTIRLSVVDADRDWATRYPLAFAEAFLAFTIDEANEEYIARLTALTEARDQANATLLEFRTTNGQALLSDQADPVLSAQLGGLQRIAENASLELREAVQDPIVTPYRIQNADETVRVPETRLELPASRPVRAVLALILGIVAAVGVVAFIEKLNPRVDSPADAERIIGAPVLAMVPVMKGKRRKLLDRADLTLFSGPFAESFRAMRSHLDFRSAAEGMEKPPSVMIVSSAPAEGKTTSTAFLALTYAEVGREVVVIGGDFRRPAIHRLFGVNRTPGLSSRLLRDEEPVSPQETVRNIVKRDEETGVRVVPSGPATDRVTGLLGDLASVTKAGIESGCTVVIDTAPIMVANDAIDFLPLVDWVVVVVRLGRTTERSLRQTITSLELNDARIAGAVVVGSLEASDAKRYYYSYYKVDEERDQLADRQIEEIRGRPRVPSANGTGLPGQSERPAAEDGAEASGSDVGPPGGAAEASSTPTSPEVRRP